jgi:hypothetical protein
MSSTSLTHRVARWWKPQPIPLPKVHHQLALLPASQRFAEVLSYSVARFEYWISPGGALREWTRLNLAVAFLIGIPALIVVPIGTYLLWQFTTWSNYLVQIAKNFVLFPVMMLAAVALLTALLGIVRAMLGK